MPLYALYVLPLLATAVVAWVALTAMGRPPGELAANANYLATRLRQQMDFGSHGSSTTHVEKVDELAAAIRSEAEAVRRELEREHRERAIATVVARVAFAFWVLLALVFGIVALRLPSMSSVLLDWLLLSTAVLATVFVPALLRTTLWNMLPELTVSMEILDLLDQWIRDTSSNGQLFQQASDRYSEWRGRRRSFFGRIRVRLLGITSAEQW